MKASFLITTDIEKKVVNKEKKIYLGDWVFSTYAIQDLKKNNKKNFSDEKEDQNIKELANRLIGPLSIYLNRYHKKNFTNLFWKNLVWVWLLYYVASNFFKWKKINELINKYKKFKYINFKISKYIYVNDVRTYTQLIGNSDEFNYLQIKKIIYFLKKNFLIKDHQSEINLNNLNLKKEKISYQKKIFNFINFFFSFFIKNNKFFISSGFSFLNLAKLNFALGQLPASFSYYFWNKRSFEIIEKKLDRKKIYLKFKPKNSFEKFIYQNIIDEIPLAYLENFSFLLHKAKKINLDPKIIITASEHYHNDLFKIWILYQKYFLKKKVIIIYHGGAHQLASGSFDKFYERNLADEVVTWTNKSNKSKLPNSKIFNNFIIQDKRFMSIYVGSEISKYPFRLGPGEKNLSEIKSFKNIEILRKKLKRNIFDTLFFAPKGINNKRSYNLLSGILGKKKFLNAGKFLKNLKNAKLVICDYPQTSFLESMATGPTFLLCDYKKFWKPEKNFLNIYKTLEKNNIIFRNPNDLAKFINKNWSDIDLWWNKTSTKNARNLFLNRFSISKSNNLIYSWKNFLLKYR
jgi:putative transferase (TIGR04331 family)